MLKKITGPGLFRLFLALVVFAHHCTRFAVGTSAVFVFFGLSGFWVYKMYMGRYRLTRQPYLTYMVSRAWRLLPSFWLISMLAMLFLYANGSLARYWAKPDLPHAIVSNLLILGYGKLQMKPIVPAWSLDIEMQFYLIAPFIALFLARRKSPALWVVLAAAVSLASSLLHNPFSLASFLVFFVIGMAAASVNWRPSGRLVLMCLAVAALMVICCLASPWRGILLVGAHPGPNSYYTPYANVALALIMMPYAIYTTGNRGFSGDGMFADLSYLIYLLHSIGIMWLDSHQGSVSHRLAFVAIAWVVVLGLSFAIWKFFDHPINRLRSRWVSRRRRVAVGEAEPARAAQDGRAT
jgi:peptidoglycan/LPS O-acetylase OafA/YrhL